MQRLWKYWRFKHLTYMVVSCVALVTLVEFGPLHMLVPVIGSTGMWGAFIGGILFVSSFTVAIGTVVILSMAETLPTWQLAITAGLGGVIGDLIVFRLVKSQLLREIKVLFWAMGGKHWQRLFKRKLLSWSLPIIGAIIIASPFPDEIGVGLMGFTKLKTWQFVVLVFILNTAGIWLIATTVQSLLK